HFQDAPNKKGDDVRKEYAAASKAYYGVSEKAEKLETAGKITAQKGRELRERAMHKYGWCHYHLGEFVNAEKTFKYQLGEWPKGEFAADAEFMVGESLYRQSKFSDAGRALRTYVKNNADGRFAPTAIWHAAEAANKLGLEELAKATGPAARKRAQA